jgi:hypothetical protein
MVWAVPSNVRLRVDAARAVFAVFLFFYFANLGHFGIHPYPCGRDSTDFSVRILIQAIPSHRGQIFKITKKGAFPGSNSRSPVRQPTDQAIPTV